MCIRMHVSIYLFMPEAGMYVSASVNCKVCACVCVLFRRNLIKYYLLFFVGLSAPAVAKACTIADRRSWPIAASVMPELSSVAAT